MALFAALLIVSYGHLQTSNLRTETRTKPPPSNPMSTKENPHQVFYVQQQHSKALVYLVMALSVATVAVAQTVPQIGLKFGINGLNGLQNTNAPTLQPGDLAGAPAYAQTN